MPHWKVFTLEAFPEEFAQAQWQLGNVYLKHFCNGAAQQH